MNTNSVRVIKKYQNRRLYDTDESAYITLTDVKDMIMSGIEFVVQDARSREDITRQVLLSIILEEEAGVMPIFSNQLLRQIITFYGNAFQSTFGRFLEGNILSFMDAQNKFQKQLYTMIPGQNRQNPGYNNLLNNAPKMDGLIDNYYVNSQKIFDMIISSLSGNPWNPLASKSGQKPHSTQPVSPKSRSKYHNSDINSTSSNLDRRKKAKTTNSTTGNRPHNQTHSNTQGNKARARIKNAQK